MNQKKIEFSNPILKDRIEILASSENTLRFRTYLAPKGGQNQLHYHTKIKETFCVIQGELCVHNNHQKHILNEGNSYTIPPFTNHMFYNTSEKEVIFDVEVQHPKKMLHALQIMYGLTNDGKTNAEGLPKNIFHTAIGLHMMDAFSPKIPFIIQKIGITTLAFFGKGLGIEKRLIKKYCA